MRCTACHGTGVMECRPCDDCGGYGQVHCCDGEQAQPERELYTIDRIVDLANRWNSHYDRARPDVRRPVPRSVQ